MSKREHISRKVSVGIACAVLLLFPSGSSSKKVSLLACGRADDQKGDEGEGLEKITEAEKGALRRGAGRGGVISQNWRDRTSAFFAVLGS